MRLSRIVAAAVAVALSLVLVAPTRAQGTSGQVSDPISTSELNHILDLYVHPTPGQAEMIEHLHDDYRAAFKRLRETDIQEFLDEMQKFSGSLPSRSVLEEFVRKWERVNKRVEAVDNVLFDGIAAGVSEAQQDGTRRARAARDRQRNMHGFASQIGVGQAVDLSEIVLAEKMTPEERQVADVTLRPYEDRLTAGLDELTKRGQTMILDVFKSLEDQGFTEMDEAAMADPERSKAFMEAMQTAWASASERLMKKASELRDLNLRTYKTIASQLPPETARRVRGRFISAAYPELGFGDAGVDRWARLATRSKSIDADAKAGVQAVLEEYRREDDKLVDDGIKLIDEATATRSPMDFNSDSARAHMEAMQALHGKRAEIAQKALASLQQILGDERFAKLQSAVTRINAHGEEELVEDGAAGTDIAASASAIEREEFSWNGGSPRPISVGAIATLGSKLGLDESERTVLETLHSDYQKEWEETLVPIGTRSTEAQQAMWSHSDGTPRMDTQKVDAYYQARAEEFAAAEKLDEAFFETVAQTLAEDGARALALARLERAIQRSPTNQSFNFMGDDTARAVDIVEVMDEGELSAEDREKASAALAAATPGLVSRLRESAGQARDLERESMRLQAESQAIWGSRGEGEQPDMAELQKWQQRWMELMSKQGAAATERSNAIRSAFDAALAEVAESARTKLELAYAREAFPSVYGDPQSALPYFDRAEAFSDLTDAQRAQVKSLRESYEAKYLAACREMLPKPDATKPQPGEAPEATFRRSMIVQQEREKVRFERDEQSARAVSQLKRILTEEQQARIPGMLEYGKTPPEPSPNFVID